MLKIKYGNRHIALKSSRESKLLLLWLMNIVTLTITRYILTQLNIYGITRTCVLVLVACLPIALFGINAMNMKTYKYSFFCCIYLLAVLTFCFSALLNDDLSYFFTRSNYGIERVFRPDSAIYALLFFSLLDNVDELYDTVNKFAYIDFVYLLVFQYLPARLGGGWEDVTYNGTTVVRAYSLSFGYDMLFPTIIFIYLYMKKKNSFHLVLSAVGLILILTNGSRGALLMPIVFVGIMLINGIANSSNTKWKWLKIFAIIIFVVILLVFGNIIVLKVADLLQSLGFESRTLEMLGKGEISSDSGRSTIWEAVWTAIKNGGVFGYGAFGDRPFVYPIHFVGYSHNILLEMVCSFGIIGILLIVIMIVKSVKMLFFCKDNKYKELFIIFFSISLQLLISMSFWYVWEFWATIAIAHKYFLKEKGRL